MNNEIEYRDMEIYVLYVRFVYMYMRTYTYDLYAIRRQKRARNFRNDSCVLAIVIVWIGHRFRCAFLYVVRSVVAIFDKLKFSAYNHIDLDLDIAVRSLTRSPSLSLSLWCHHSPLPMSPPTLAGIAHLTISPFRKIDIDSSKRTLLSLPLLSSSFLSTAATNRCVAMCMCMCSHRKPFPRALR